MISLVKQRFPNEPVGAIGYSLGANALLKYLGETEEASGLDLAISVCPPLVLSTCANTINTGFAKVYQHYLLKLMHGQYAKKQAAYPQLQLPDLPTGLNTFWKFDDAVTAPIHGFANAQDYYDKCLSLIHISEPTRPY